MDGFWFFMSVFWGLSDQKHLIFFGLGLNLVSNFCFSRSLVGSGNTHMRNEGQVFAYSESERYQRIYGIGEGHNIQFCECATYVH